MPIVACINFSSYLACTLLFIRMVHWIMAVSHSIKNEIVKLCTVCESLSLVKCAYYIRCQRQTVKEHCFAQEMQIRTNKCYNNLQEKKSEQLKLNWILTICISATSTSAAADAAVDDVNRSPLNPKISALLLLRNYHLNCVVDSTDNFFSFPLTQNFFSLFFPYIFVTVTIKISFRFGFNQCYLFWVLVSMPHALINSY